MNREKITLNIENSRYAVYGELEGFKCIQEINLGNSRWEILYKYIIQRESDNKYFCATGKRGAGNDIEFDWSEVFPKEKITIIYE